MTPQDSAAEVMARLRSDLGALDPAVHGEDLAAATELALDDLDSLAQQLEKLREERDEAHHRLNLFGAANTNKDGTRMSVRERIDHLASLRYMRGYNARSNDNIDYHARAKAAEAERDAALERVKKLEQVAEAAQWYIECLENVRARKVVRGLSEAQAAYQSALTALADDAEENVTKESSGASDESA